MTDSSNYIPPKVWEYEANNMSTFSKTIRPIAGSTHEKMLPVGKHPLQLYSLATPNGVKVTILLEELIELGEEGAEYDAHLIRISEGDQFGSGFVDINPNSKIPALVDRSGDVPLRVFESGAILLYLAEKFNLFIPNNHSSRTECLSWLFWQMGSAPYLGGGLGIFIITRMRKLNILLIVLQWRLRGNLTYSINIWMVRNIWSRKSIQLLI